MVRQRINGEIAVIDETSAVSERKLSMIYFIFFLICFTASAVGAICGIGGGVIIKPLLDAFDIMSVTTISFLSGCTVLSMSAYSVIKGRISNEIHISKKTGLPLAIGSAAGGFIGKGIFTYLSEVFTDANRIGTIQAICLLMITVGTLLYTINKQKIKTYHIESFAFSIMIGAILGILSAFLGIGGGPINIVVLYFFYSMGTKEAVENSLYTIFFSQLVSLGASVITGKIPPFSYPVLFMMILGGIGGGILGRLWNKRIEEKKIERLFIGLMFFMILINIYNICQFGFGFTSAA